MECWEVAGTTLGSNQKSVVVYAKNEEGYVKEETTVKEERPRKKARKEITMKAEESPREAEEPPREAEEALVGWITQKVFEKGMKQMADAMRDGFGMILREIKHVADRVEVVAERIEALEQLVKSTKGTASNEAPHTPSKLPKHTDDFGTTYSRILPGSRLVSHLIRRLTGSHLGESVNGEKGDPSVSKEDTEMKEVEEARGTKEAEEANAANKAEEAKANAAKEAEEANATKTAKAAKEADVAKAAKEADTAKKVKALKEAKALKESKEAKALRDAKAAKEARYARSAEDAKTAKEARKAKEARDAKEAKEVKEAEEDEKDKASEGSIVIMDKQKPTASDLETEEARRIAKSEAGLANVRARSERERKLASSQQSPFQENITAKSIIPNKKIGLDYDSFALPVDKHKSSALTNWLKKDRKVSSGITYQTTSKKASSGTTYQTTSRKASSSTIYQTTSRKASSSTTYQTTSRKSSSKSSGKSSRSKRMCILDHAFAQWWIRKYSDWVSSEPDANGLGKRLSGGRGIYTEALHIVVWDIIVGCIRKAQLDQVMAPFVNMVPYLLVECVATVEERCKYSLEPFAYEVANAPQCESGDCGLFSLKYIECHALGFPFSGSLNPKNNKAIREKMAVDIFEEIPDAHQTEITNVDVNQDIQLPDDFQTNSRRLPPDDFYQTTSRRLPTKDFHQTTSIRRLPPDDIQTTSRRLPEVVQEISSHNVELYDLFLCSLNIYKPCVSLWVCVLSSWKAPTKIAILISFIFPVDDLHSVEDIYFP
ncbi:hypothetical protein N665_0150s0018 [Sinapis alba]|nr:hypothetical protein N665_0150s0018 [Sinapis alba]